MEEKVVLEFNVYKSIQKYIILHQIYFEDIFLVLNDLNLTNDKKVEAIIEVSKRAGKKIYKGKPQKIVMNYLKKQIQKD